METQARLLRRCARCDDCGSPVYIVVGMLADPTVPSGLAGPLILACECRTYSAGTLFTPRGLVRAADALKRRRP
jgi:hypothetical protein